MVDVSNAELKECYDDVRNDKTETDWALFGYTSDGKALEFRGKGSGGLDEMKEQFKDDEVIFFFSSLFGDLIEITAHVRLPACHRWR